MNLCVCCVYTTRGWCPTFKVVFQNFAGSLVYRYTTKCKNGREGKRRTREIENFHPDDEESEGRDARGGETVPSRNTRPPLLFCFNFVLFFHLFVWEWKVRNKTKLDIQMGKRDNNLINWHHRLTMRKKWVGGHINKEESSISGQLCEWINNENNNLLYNQYYKWQYIFL